jgi:threonine synthase
MGAPIDKFVIGNNANDPFVEYLASGFYHPRASVPTLSNAMDIGRPNNYPRIADLFSGNHDAITKVCYGASFSDQDTERHMRRTHATTGYVMCPHTAVGHMAMQQFSKLTLGNFIKVTVATAHPAKFAGDVERIIREDVPLPEPLKKAMKLEKIMHNMPPTLDALSSYLGQRQI